MKVTKEQIVSQLVDMGCPTEPRKLMRMRKDALLKLLHNHIDPPKATSKSKIVVSPFVRLLARKGKQRYASGIVQAYLRAVIRGHDTCAKGALKRLKAL
jgi:hypothetical protein